MISAPCRSKAISLVDEAVENNVRLVKACAVLKISERTYHRWKKLYKNTGTFEDLRKNAIRPEPANKLTEEERKQIISIANSPEFASSPPCEIVPALADRNIYDLLTSLLTSTASYNLAYLKLAILYY